MNINTPQTEINFDATLTVTLLNKAYSDHLFSGRWLIILAVTLIGISVFLDSQSDDLSYLSISSMTAATIVLLMFFVAWLKQRKFIKRWNHNQKDVPVKYKLFKDKITAESTMSMTTLKWEVFEKIMIKDLYINLYTENAGMMTLPTKQLQEEVIDYLIDRFTSHQLPVVDNRANHKENSP